jgi:protein-disulfide isomerase
VKAGTRNAWGYRPLVVGVGAAVIVALVSLGAALGLYRQNNALRARIRLAEQATPGLSPTIEATQPPRLNVSIDDDPVKGSRYAPVTIVEFGEFQCSDCAEFATEILPLIEEQYVSTGEIRLVFRDFPLSTHAYAQMAARAAECANDQGKFWEYHGRLFEKQPALDVASLKRYAEDLELDLPAFEGCVNSLETAAEVRKDVRDGQMLGVRRVPTFFVNGVRVVGPQPFAVFRRVIEQELRQ